MNNIKTKSVIVNTSEIVDSKNDFFKTKLQICFWRTEFEFRLIKEAPVNTFLNQLLINSKRDGKLCMFNSDPAALLGDINYQNTLVILSETK